MMALSSMAKALGGDVVMGTYVLCPGPGHSPKDRSLSVTPSAKAQDGFVVHSFAGKDWRTCRDHVAGKLGIPTWKPEQRAQKETVSPAKPDMRSEGSIDLWKAGLHPRRTLAEIHLVGRGLELFDDIAGRVVRFHPACPFGPGARHPTMITAFRSIADDTLQAIHRTALTPDGQKIGRKMLGPVAGAAIKIDCDTDVEQGLTVCEGFETGLAGRAMGFRPVWALGSAGAIKTFPVLAGIDCLTILGEPDAANAAAVQECGNRWTDAGREVRVVMSKIGGDIADAWKAIAA